MNFIKFQLTSVYPTSSQSCVTKSNFYFQSPKYSRFELRTETKDHKTIERKSFHEWIKSSLLLVGDLQNKHVSLSKLSEQFVTLMFTEACHTCQRESKRFLGKFNLHNRSKLFLFVFCLPARF